MIYEVAGFLVEHFPQTAIVSGLQRIEIEVLPFQNALRFCIVRTCGIPCFIAWLNVVLGVYVGSNRIVGSKVLQDRFFRRHLLKR